MTVHTLKAKGAAFDTDGVTRLDPDSTAGTGYAACACGWVSSESLPSGRARKAAHTEHKATSAEEPERSPEALGLEEDAGATMPESEPEPEVVVDVREFHGNYAIELVPFAQTLAEAFRGVDVQQELVKGSLTRRAVVSGPKDEVRRFLSALDAEVPSAFAGLRQWQKDHIEVRRTQTDQQKYLAHRAYLRTHAEWARNELTSTNRSNNL